MINVAILVLIACSAGEPAETAVDGRPAPIILPNHGGGMEGHTPRGFQGTGTGLFVGDNLNASFPDGDGIQAFLTFDLSSFAGQELVSATLLSDEPEVSGRPFADLGPLVVDEVRYEEFSADLWDLEPEPGGLHCDFATSLDGRFSCDVTEAVQRSLDDGYSYAQFRLRFSKAGDGDGQPDLVFFFISNPNTNEPGIFELVLNG